MILYFFYQGFSTGPSRDILSMPLAKCIVEALQLEIQSKTVPNGGTVTRKARWMTGSPPVDGTLLQFSLLVA